MKKTVLKSKLYTIAIVAVLSIALAACSVITKPYITNAGNNKIVNLGDSIFALSGGISDYIHSYAGKTFRRYATSGAELNGGIIEPSVASQYARAKADYATIDTIFMDGGGNDILIPATMYFDPYNCKVDWWESGLSSKCKSFINDIYVETVTLLNQMGREGVDNIIFQGYYRIKFGVIGTTALNPAVDYGDTKLAAAVQNATLVPYRVFIDPRSSIVNSDIIIDGVHPADSGSKKLAGLIWNKLKYLPY
ncbi:MAG: SGNH/GDSL hydrolase family protein [Desulfosalsimonadaceae bacterium]